MRHRTHSLEQVDSVSEMTPPSLCNDRVVVRRVVPAEYPDFPYHPPAFYPECRQVVGRHLDRTNRVYDGVRNIFADLALDINNLGRPEWNPLGRFVSPGDRAVVKPNWVLHANQDDGSIESLITHTSLIRAVVDYLIIALRQNGIIEILDAPLQNCDFDELVRRSLIIDLVEYYRQKYSGVTFSILDVRKTTLHTKVSQIPGIVRQSAQAGDPRGYTMVDLRSESILTDIHHRFRRFRVANYDHRLMRNHHNQDRHEYLVSNSILSADFIVNIPKLKFHIKAGITGALKNLVGINGHKEYLPHHTNGGPDRGGDQYPRRSYIKPLINRLYDDYWMNVNRRSQVHNVLEAGLIRALRKTVSVIEGDRMYDGAWSGNDTIPRTTLDLNHVLYFYDHTKGVLSDTQLRNVLHIVDGVVAGDGYGPLRPSRKPAGVIVGGWNPLTIDVCGALLMGLDPLKVPLLHYGVTHAKSRIFPSRSALEAIQVTDGGVQEAMGNVCGLGFRIPREWGAAVLPTLLEASISTCDDQLSRG